MSNTLDPDQVRCFVGPDLGPNCLQRLWTDEIWIEMDLVPLPSEDG